MEQSTQGERRDVSAQTTESVFADIRLPSAAAYKVVPQSYGEARSFEITVGLREGYGEAGAVSGNEQVRRAALSWMKERAERNLPFLTGVLSGGDVLYAYPSTVGASVHHEPVATFRGEVSTLYNKELSNDEVRDLLTELAGHLGSSAEQTRVYIRYQNETWVIQQEGRATPRGDTV